MLASVCRCRVLHLWPVTGVTGQTGAAQVRRPNDHRLFLTQTRASTKEKNAPLLRAKASWLSAASSITHKHTSASDWSKRKKKESFPLEWNENGCRWNCECHKMVQSEACNKRETPESSMESNVWGNALRQLAPTQLKMYDWSWTIWVVETLFPKPRSWFCLCVHTVRELLSLCNSPLNVVLDRWRPWQ